MRASTPGPETPRLEILPPGPCPIAVNRASRPLARGRNKLSATVVKMAQRANSAWRPASLSEQERAETPANPTRARGTRLALPSNRMEPETMPHRTILIVDDDPAVLRAYGRLLVRLGHRLILQADCAAAFGQVEALGAGDLLILDQQMPESCGLDWLRRLRERGVWRDAASRPTILLVTASADAQTKIEASTLGVTEVLAKPVDPHRLLGTVETALASGWRAPGPPGPSLTARSGQSYTEGSMSGKQSGGVEEQESMRKHGHFVTLALFTAASVIFGMVLAGGLNLTIPGRAAEPVRVDQRPLHAAAEAQEGGHRCTRGNHPGLVRRGG